MPRTKERSIQRAAWHDALLEANRMVTKANLGRQDAFLNRVEDRLDDACLGARDIVTERDALREALNDAAAALADAAIDLDRAGKQAAASCAHRANITIGLILGLPE